MSDQPDRTTLALQDIADREPILNALREVFKEHGRAAGDRVVFYCSVNCLTDAVIRRLSPPQTPNQGKES